MFAVNSVSPAEIDAVYQTEKWPFELIEARGISL